VKRPVLKISQRCVFVCSCRAARSTLVFPAQCSLHPDSISVWREVPERERCEDAEDFDWFGKCSGPTSWQLSYRLTERMIGYV